MPSSWSRIGVVAFGLLGLAGCAEVETVKAPIDIPSRIYTANESSNDVFCGYRVEEIENSLTQQVRYLDKLVDELAK